jgi:DNA-binding response OmpR family regulator
MRASPRVVTRGEIEQAIWGDNLTDSDALRTHISAIRQTTDKPFKRALLRTMHGVGYRLCEPDAP